MKRISFFVGLLFLVGLVFAATPNPGHDADDIYVTINNKARMSLQDAIDGGEFGMDYVGGGSFGADLDFGHEEVYVKIGGSSKTLQQAIDDRSLCASGSGGSGGYSGSVSTGHNSDDILVNFNGEKSLQQAINQGLFGYNVWSPDRGNTCTTTNMVQSNCGATRTVKGTKCCVSSWSPNVNTKCSGTRFTQTSNCG
ncbi:hypothetical protein HNV12_03455, partial [Methanococcoides sp. SA1]|nr:hypothetical protein [Methanococcoides sp. SA1]